MKFGDLILKIRRKFGMDQKTLAKKSGVSQSLISKFEQDKVDPRLSSFVKLLKALGFRLRITKK